MVGLVMRRRVRRLRPAGGHVHPIHHMLDVPHVTHRPPTWPTWLGPGLPEDDPEGDPRGRTRCRRPRTPDPERLPRTWDGEAPPALSQPCVRHPRLGGWRVGHGWRPNVISINSSAEETDEAVPEMVAPDPAPRPSRRSAPRRTFLQQLINRINPNGLRAAPRHQMQDAQMTRQTR